MFVYKQLLHFLFEMMWRIIIDLVELNLKKRVLGLSFLICKMGEFYTSPLGIVMSLSELYA